MQPGDELYHELILDLYRHPLNKRQLPRFDRSARVHNPLCSDWLEVFVALGADGTIADIGYQGEGCAISEAGASLATEWAKGKTGEDAVRFSPAELTEKLGLTHLNPTRLRCATLGLAGLKKCFEQN